MAQLIYYIQKLQPIIKQIQGKIVYTMPKVRANKSKY